MKFSMKITIQKVLLDRVRHLSAGCRPCGLGKNYQVPVHAMVSATVLSSADRRFGPNLDGQGCELFGEIAYKNQRLFYPGNYGLALPEVIYGYSIQDIL